MKKVLILFSALALVVSVSLASTNLNGGDKDKKCCKTECNKDHKECSKDCKKEDHKDCKKEGDKKCCKKEDKKCCSKKETTEEKK